MVNKISLKDEVNSVGELFRYKRVGTLNSHMLNVLQAQNRVLDFHVHENSDEKIGRASCRERVSA